MNNKKSKIKSYKFGIYAEYIAIFFLKIKGYKIIKRRYKNKCGEIDIIAKKSNMLIAIEVKARKNIDSIEEVLSYHQMKRIENSMDIFCSSKKYYDKYSIRFDLIIIDKSKFIPLHLKGYF